MTTIVVPALSRDPYRVISRLVAVADAFCYPRTSGLWVPAFAGTTRDKNSRN
jgi:hypothetical protein